MEIPIAPQLHKFSNPDHSGTKKKNNKSISAQLHKTRKKQIFIKISFQLKYLSRSSDRLKTSE